MKTFAALLALAALAASPLPAAAQASPGGLEARFSLTAFNADMAAFAAARKAQPPQTCQLVMTGSSTAKRWETFAEDMAPMGAINTGFGGSITRQATYNFDHILTPYKPRQILFYEGDNDINAGLSAEQTFADFQGFMRVKDLKLGTTPVYFIGIKPSKLRVSQMPEQARFNAMVKTWADQRPDLVYIDVWNTVLTDGKPGDYFVADGLHLNPAGYANFTKVIKPVLMQKPPTRAPGCPA